MSQILVVDGESDMAATYERLLRRAGHRVVLVATRAGGVRFLEGLPPRLVTSYLRLPDGDGLDVIRAAGRLPAAPAVVAITAFASRAARRSALDAGASAFLAKPFAIDELSGLVERLIQRPAAPTPAWAGDAGLDERRGPVARIASLGKPHPSCEPSTPCFAPFAVPSS